MIIAKPVFNHPGSPPSAMLGAGPRFNISEYGLPATGSFRPRRTSVRRGSGEGCCDGGPQPDDCCDPYTGRGMTTYATRSMRGLGAFELFESPVWTHRKWIVLGGVALIGLSIMAGGAALLR